MKSKDAKFITTPDVIICMLISIISLLVRLWGISMPDSVIFDEIHFGNFTNWYVTREYFFDIHPPLGKLIMAGIAYLAQYPGHINFVGEDQSKKYPMDSMNYVALRITPAVFQSFCFPLIYLSLRSFDFKIITSLTAATMLMLETSIHAEGRFILSDGILHFFSCLAIYTLSLFLRCPTKNRLYAAGISLGCACCCKNTALGLVALAGITQLYWMFTSDPRPVDVFIRAAGFLIPIIVIFFGSWTIHFIILIYHGQGSHYMGEDFQRTLVYKNGSTPLVNHVKYIPLLSRIIELNVRMHSGNMQIIKPHPYQSNPINWPVLTDKYVLFFSSDDHLIACMGQPITYWLSTLGILLTLFLFNFEITDLRHAFFVIGWTVSYFPFVLIPRSMFLYHYIIPLFFAVMNLAACIESCFKRSFKVIDVFLIIVSIALFFYFNPFVYGTKCPGCTTSRIWLQQWKYGPTKRKDQQNFDTVPMYGTVPL